MASQGIQVSKEEPPRVAVIVISWNRKKDIVELLESLGGISYKNFEVIIVDNGSSDGTVDLLREKYPAVQIIETHENLGFAKANNIGARAALQKGADYILFLNDDTIVDPAFLDELIKFSESDMAIGAVGPKIYYYDDPKRIWSAADQANAREIDEGQADKIVETRSVIGCAFLVKRVVVEKAGLMDEDLFLYCEEDEYCHRIRQAGYRLFYLPTSRIWHKVALKGDFLKPYQAYYIIRNSLIVRRKKYSGMRFLLSLAGYFGSFVPQYSWYCVKKGQSDLLVPVFRGVRDGVLWCIGLRKAGKSDAV